jgi:PTS system fructose-specific IIC component
MPHAIDSSINEARVLFARSKEGIDFNAIDNQPVHLFFMIAAPANADQEHLQTLATLSTLLLNKNLLRKLMTAQTPEDVISYFKEAEHEEKDSSKQTSNSNRPLIVGVTACINGIAHTYMAQKALIDAGKKRNIDVRIETNGSEGVKDKLTANEIRKAKGVIIASDKKVDMPRFDGKRVTIHPVIDGINEPDKLIETIMDDKAPVYHVNKDDSSEPTQKESSKGIWTNIYRDLMNGVSHMLPFVIGGGILMAISFIVENYAGGQKSPAFIFLNNAGNLAFAFMIPILSAYIAEAIGDLPALMPGLVGGYMAAIFNNKSGFTVNAQANATSPAGFLGGIAAGFIAGYLILTLKKVFSKMPKNLEGTKPMLLYPILGLLFIALIMFYIINPIFSSINFALTRFLNHMGTGNLVLLTTLLAGMQATDMGGPINKASYVFASGAFANDPHSTVAAIMMAAVMVGGMVPSFATAIGTTFFKNKYTKEERRAGISNWVLGFSFITEGAIPFAAADPGRVIPSCVLGSAIGGALVGLWHVAVPAPHGGLWVSLLANHPLLFILATIIGSIIAGVVLSLWKKKVS